RVGDFYWGGPGQNRAGQKDRTTETRDRELWYVSLEDNGCLSAQVITSADSRCEPVLTLNTATKSLTIQTLARGQSQPATARGRGQAAVLLLGMPAWQLGFRRLFGY